MRKILIWIGIIFAGMLLVTFIAGLIVHEPRPAGISGPAADSLARKMEAAVHKEAWDSTAVVQWTFAGVHHFLWDKERNYCRITWKENEVLLNLNDLSGRAWSDGTELGGAEAGDMVQQGWSYFANDSFWLNACVKVFDPGTERRIVPLETGGEGLMVTYTKGGVTPGDSYLWILDENGLPQRWKMWVSILPVGGVETSWESWTQLATGAKIATIRQSPLYTLEITNLKGAASLEAFGLFEDPFEKLEAER